MRFLHRPFVFLVALPLCLYLIGCAPRKTKTTLDRVYELDPSGRLYIHPELQVRPPRSLAVLPFRSLVGEGRAEGSQELLLSLREKENPSPERLAQQMRLAFYGQLAQLAFQQPHPGQIDIRLKEGGLTSWEALKSLSPQELGSLIGTEAVIFGEVTHFDYYYGLLYTQLAVGLRLEMFSTSTGELLWRFQDARRDHTVRIALDPIGIAVGLFQAGFSLRPINMTRAMDEICREAAAHIPVPVRQEK